MTRPASRPGPEAGDECQILIQLDPEFTGKMLKAQALARTKSVRISMLSQLESRTRSQVPLFCYDMLVICCQSLARCLSYEHIVHILVVLSLAYPCHIRVITKLKKNIPSIHQS